MINARKLTALIAALLFGVTLFIAPAPADAKVKIYKKDGNSLKFGFRIQSRLRLLNEAETSDTDGDGIDDKTTGRDYQFDFRRLRIAGSGNIGNKVSFMLQTDIFTKPEYLDSKKGADQTKDQSLQWRDAVITLKFSNAARLSFGLFKVQFTRSRNGSGFGQLALDRPFVESASTNSSSADGGIGGKRDQQIVLWGNMDKFQYRVGLGDGAKTIAGSKDSLRTTARVHYAFWDKESGLGYKETYHGKKKIMTLGFGYDSQADVAGSAGNTKANTATTIDFTYENKMASGGVPNFNAAYYSRDDGSSGSTVTSNKATAYHVTVGYLFPNSGFQPYLRTATWDTDKKDSDKTITNLGLNYLIKGHKAKLVFDWENIDFEKDGSTKAKKDHSIITMQWQWDY